MNPRKLEPIRKEKKYCLTFSSFSKRVRYRQQRNCFGTKWFKTSVISDFIVAQFQTSIKTF